MSEAIIKILASYLAGSLVGSLIIGRLRGIDIRELGSGNAGGTNALRTQGKTFALGVMIIDVGKGYVATALIAGLWAIHPDELPALCAVAVVLGHVYPLWFGFRGGKGVATLMGALAGIDPALLVPVLATWCVVALTTGFVGLASVVAALILPLYLFWQGTEPRLPLCGAGIFLGLLLLYTHRSNLARMVAGTEPRMRALWSLGGSRP